MFDRYLNVSTCRFTEESVESKHVKKELSVKTEVRCNLLLAEHTQTNVFGERMSEIPPLSQ